MAEADELLKAAIDDGFSGAAPSKLGGRFLVGVVPHVGVFVQIVPEGNPGGPIQVFSAEQAEVAAENILEGVRQYREQQAKLDS